MTAIENKNYKVEFMRDGYLDYVIREMKRSNQNHILRSADGNITAIINNKSVTFEYLEGQRFTKLWDKITPTEVRQILKGQQ